jgi:hypothetical protein
VSPAYNGPERRRSKHLGSDPVTNDDLDEALALHAEQDRAYVAALYEKAMEAFPDGPEQHRIAHEQMIKAAKAEETFWRELKSEIAKKSIFGIAQILLILIVAGLGAKLFGIPVIAALLGQGK